MNQDQYIKELEKEIINLKNSIRWYQDTYENRKLIGIAKDRFVNKARPFTPNLNSLVKLKGNLPTIFSSKQTKSKLADKKIICTIVNYNCNENARLLRNSFSRFFDTVVIDSGSTVKDQSFINLPNVYYAGLYNHAYQMALDKGYEYLFFICSDVVVTDDAAAKMAANLQEIDLSDIGVYSPSSSGRSHYQCKKSAERGLRIVDFVEGFIFLAKVEMLKQFSPLDTKKNLLGWGIDVAKGYYAKKMDLLCVVDDEVNVYHPAETGYSSNAAEVQMYDWFESLSESAGIKKFHLNRVNLIRLGLADQLKISVIIPCFNQAKYLRETLKSLFTQTYSNYELIIINDGSKDETDEIAAVLAKQFNQIKYIKKDNAGLGAARNTGLEHATGTLIQFLDADDKLSINKFSDAVQTFANNPESDIVYSKYICFEDGNEKNTWTYSRVELQAEPVTDLIMQWEKELSIPVHCFLFKRDIIGATRFDVILPNHEDWEFHLSIAAKKPNYLHNSNSEALYRIKPSAMSQDKEMMRHGKNLCLANIIASRKFNKYYNSALFSRFDYSLAVGIVTCKKNEERIAAIRQTWAKDLSDVGVQYFFIIGDETIEKPSVEGDILYVKCPDNYESLPKKVLLFYEYIRSQTNIDYVFKIDDDCYLNFESLFATQFWRFDYFGRIVATNEKDLNPSWHMGKCENDAMNNTVYQTSYLGPWCGGGFGYFLSRRALDALHQKKMQIWNELYEDKAIGDALRQMGILPVDNENYRTLNLQQFNINHGSNQEVETLLEHLSSSVYEYENIIEITNPHYFSQIHKTKNKLNPLKIKWEEGKMFERAFWSEWISTAGGNWSEDFKKRMMPDLILDPFLENFLKGNEEINILDVGAGPLTVIGKKTTDGRKVNVVAVDPLAQDYNRLLKQHNISPIAAITEAEAEKLNQKFGENTFDMVHMRNALDHCYDPLLSLYQLIKVVKQNRVTILEHNTNYGLKTNYQAFVQWNICVKGSDLIIWNKETELNISQELRSTAKVMAWGNDNWTTAVIEKL